MKILFSVDSKYEVCKQFNFFLHYVDAKHEIKIASYSDINQFKFTVDFCLDNYSPCSDINTFKDLIKEIADFGPDIVICNNEPTCAKISRHLKIPLWYCSSIHLLDGAIWNRKDFNYYNGAMLPLWNNLRWMPDPDRVFVYSPIGNLNGTLSLKSGYEWITPYHQINNNCIIKNNIFISMDDVGRKKLFKKILDKTSFINTLHFSEAEWCLIDGTTTHLANAIYNKKNICVCPQINEPETVLNAIVCKKIGIGIELGQVEYREGFASETIDEVNEFFTKSYLVNNKQFFLHDAIRSI